MRRRATKLEMIVSQPARMKTTTTMSQSKVPRRVPWSSTRGRNSTLSGIINMAVVWDIPTCVARSVARNRYPPMSGGLECWTRLDHGAFDLRNFCWPCDHVEFGIRWISERNEISCIPEVPGLFFSTWQKKTIPTSVMAPTKPVPVEMIMIPPRRTMLGFRKKCLNRVGKLLFWTCLYWLPQLWRWSLLRLVRDTCRKLLKCLEDIMKSMISTRPNLCSSWLQIWDHQHSLNMFEFLTDTLLEFNAQFRFGSVSRACKGHRRRIS